MNILVEQLTGRQAGRPAQTQAQEVPAQEAQAQHRKAPTSAISAGSNVGTTMLASRPTMATHTRGPRTGGLSMYTQLMHTLAPQITREAHGEGAATQAPAATRRDATVFVNNAEGSWAQAIRTEGAVLGPVPAGAMAGLWARMLAEAPKDDCTGTVTLSDFVQFMTEHRRGHRGTWDRGSRPATVDTTHAHGKAARRGGHWTCCGALVRTRLRCPHLTLKDVARHWQRVREASIPLAHA